MSSADIATLLVRYDIEQALTTILAKAEESAAEAVEAAWTTEGASAYREALLADISRVYADARERLVAEITAAYASIPDAEPFVPGVTPPGTNPAAEVRRERAVAVRRAISGFGRVLAVRNQLTVFTAGKGSDSAAVLAEAQLRHDAGEDVELEWVASMEGKDPRSCGWCRHLHGTRVPVGSQFPHPQPIGKRRPPRLYLGTLFGPPLHPRCQCKLRIVRVAPAVGPGTGAPPAPEPGPPGQGDFISSETIRSMPEEQYSKLHHFLRSALHELGQVLTRLRHPYG